MQKMCNSYEVIPNVSLSLSLSLSLSHCTNPMNFGSIDNSYSHKKDGG